ncbi:TPA: site-specific integrase, partial [Escherichia coli]|nr:site-specific integrase [Escherichia coli]
HTRIEQTMVYAHFAPEYLQDAISLNPLRGGTEVESVHTVSTVE